MTEPAIKASAMTTAILLITLSACSSSQPPSADDAPDPQPEVERQFPQEVSDELPEHGEDSYEAPSPCDAVQEERDRNPILPDLLEEYLSEDARALLEDPETHRLQILIAEVVELDDEYTCLVKHGFRVDAEYFYPASSIKTLASAAAIIKFDSLLESDAELWFHNPDDFTEQSDALDDADFDAEHFDTLRNIIDDTQIVSSNPGYNRLFDLVGHKSLHQVGKDMGLKSLRMNHRFFSQRSPAQERWSPRISISEAGVDGDADDPELEEFLAPRTSTIELTPIEIEGIRVGESYIESDEVIDEPMDFREMNYLSLADHLRLMVGLLRPQVLQDTISRPFRKLQWTSHHALLRQAMERDPEEFAEERGYDLGEDVQRRFKPMLSGIGEYLDADIVSYFNKGGRAYGFHTENAYIVNRTNDRAVFVAATAYVNENRRQLIAALENWWDKYRTTLRDIEAERDEARAELEGFLKELGYV